MKLSVKIFGLNVRQCQISDKSHVYGSSIVIIVMNLDHHNLYDHDHIIMSSRALPSSFFIITVVITITISNLIDILSRIMYSFFFQETVNREIYVYESLETSLR